MKILFVATSRFSSGEAITAAEAARCCASQGAEVRAITSQEVKRWLDDAVNRGVDVLAGDLQSNQSTWRNTVDDFRPDAIVFADFPLLPANLSGTPLVDEHWLKELEDSDSALLTFDHVGWMNVDPNSQLAQKLPPTPARMRALLPCPVMEPAPSRNHRGIPFKYWAPPTGRDPAVLSGIRKRYLDHEEDLLVFHAIPVWSQVYAQKLQLPYFDVLPSVLGEYFSKLGRPVTILSVNTGQMLTQCPQPNVRIVNVDPMSAADFIDHIASADLMITENCLSVTLGKAICMGVPSVAWFNTYDASSFPLEAWDKEFGETLSKRAANCLYRWISFPLITQPFWDALLALRGSTFPSTHYRLEIFGGRPTAESLAELLTDSEARSRLKTKQRDYAERVAALPDALEAIRLAAA